MKKVLSLLVVLVMVAALFGACAAPAPTESAASSAPAASSAAVSSAPAESSSAAASSAAASSGKKFKVSVILMALNSDYWHMVEAGAINAGKELGCEVTVVGPNAESDVSGQVAMVEDQLAKGANAIVLSRNDDQALLPVCKKAKDAKVPVITIDGDIGDPSLRDSFIGTENVDAAAEAGKFIAGKLQKGDKVAIIRGLPGAPTHDKREKGAKDEFEKAGLNLVTIQPADSERAKGQNVAENILQANPDIKAIYCTNDEMALGAVQAVKAMGKSIIVVGFDGAPDALKSIIAGELTATVAQMPVMEGYTGVQTALKVLNGEKVEDQIPLPVKVVTKDIATDFQKDIQAQLDKAKS